MSARHPAYQDHDIQQFIITEGRRLELDPLRVALAEAFPGRSLPSRSSLARYLMSIGYRGRFGRGLKDPEVRAFLDQADRRLSIEQWREELRVRFPGTSIPDSKAISRYILSRSGQSKPRPSRMPIAVMERLAELAPTSTVAEIQAILAGEFPGQPVPSRTVIARHVQRAGVTGRKSWCIREPRIAAFVRDNRHWASLDFLHTMLLKEFPGARVPSRSTLGRYLKELKSRV